MSEFLIVKEILKGNYKKINEEQLIINDKIYNIFDVLDIYLTEMENELIKLVKLFKLQFEFKLG